jgi:hypothetical protein
MTIDERLERITERQEALVESLEVMRIENARTDEKIRHVAVIAEQNEVLAGQMMRSIERLAHIVDVHEERIKRLE